ncbi:T9SS type A sorting domain-containing protein [Chryseobacterium sp. Bi04]|uniref:T9SS type A sorting domain-containing protein n=1 Tax=Chryseobacterium sp. Bi04 TaxID=2822345 RepID=UPI001D6EA255|nr:T9SS type A sorting domain-containing protein [Chryseobacterium sp. Bi04]CAH0149854.1 hypothetical protein SRABI04_00753 [Chryseobacterium sp. Bi04]
MKTHVLIGHCLVKTVLLALFLFMINPSAFAQTKTYANSQTNQVYGICLNCGIQNSENAVGNNEDNFATFLIPLGVAARIEQTLNFPATDPSLKKIVIGIGTSESLLSVQLLAGVSIETFNGNTSNNDYKIVNNDLLKVGFTNPSKGTIEVTTTQPFDRVKISLNAGLLNLNGGLRVYYAYKTVDDKVYVNSESHLAFGEPCPECVENPQNALGPNENDYMKLRKKPGVIDVQQDLYFPAVKTFTKVVIGIGTDTPPLSSSLNGLGIHILQNGSTPFDERMRPEIKIDPLNPGRGTIEFWTSLPYDGIRLNLYMNHLRIYYAYQESLHLNACSHVPFNPFYYFSFNGNTNSTVPGFNFSSSSIPVYKSDMICNQALTSLSPPYTLESPEIPASLLTGDISISFWASINEGDKDIPNPDDPDETIPPTGPQPFLTMDAFGQKINISPKIIKVGMDADEPQIEKQNFPNHFVHYTLVLKENPDNTDGGACLYINGVLGGETDDEDVDCITWNQADRNTHKKIKLALDRAQVDELIIYNRALNPGEIRTLANSYERPNSSSANSVSNTDAMRTIPAEETLTISPNPTTGTVTLDGKILLADSDISIRNTSGMEVYHAKITSKTFDLPSTIPGGVYLLILQTKDKKVHTRKIIVTR